MSLTIKIEFKDFITERVYDLVTVYDGSSTSTLALATLSGESVRDGYSVQSTGQYMTVRLQTDSSVQMMGFQACVCTSGK
ncbi:hypothetical protein LSH36_520g01086 [Paralvinella palmiformis]|uniref:CUB domain-containing protein n=1 Tax=Paralvinella palmiformis TaxID=53620 RepID=A0AAD9J980_9ANNE|nr:hypothetical protein LSH36_520g01086 [Paralvinella palmiformis]